MKTLSKTLQKTTKSLKNNAILAIITPLLLFLSIIIPGQTYASAPTASTNPASVVSSTKAVLNGFVDSGGLKTTYWFELNENGTIDSFGQGNRSTDGDVSVSIVQLDPNITYSVRLVAQNSDGKSYGDTISFSTNRSSGQTNTGGGTTFNNTGSNTVYYNNTQSNSGSTVFGRVPIVNTTYATNVTDTGVSLNGYVDPNGGNNVYRWFEWGTTQSLGNISGNLSAGTNPNYFSHGISGLERNTTYYFRAGAHSSAGTVYGSIFSFTTGVSQTATSNVTPIILLKSPSYITTDSAQLNASAIKGGASLASGYFEWGTSQSLGNSTQAQSFSDTSSPNISAPLQNLKPNTDYSFRVVVQDSTSAVYKSQINTLHTSAISGAAVTTIDSQKKSSGSATVVTTSSDKTTATQKSESNTGVVVANENKDNNSGAAGALFAKTSVALLGWFLSIILLLIVIIMGVMLRRKGKAENTEITSIGYKEFPDLPGHPTSNTK